MTYCWWKRFDNESIDNSTRVIPTFIEAYQSRTRGIRLVVSLIAASTDWKSVFVPRKISEIPARLDRSRCTWVRRPIARISCENVVLTTLRHGSSRETKLCRAIEFFIQGGPKLRFFFHRYNWNQTASEHSQSKLSIDWLTDDALVERIPILESKERKKIADDSRTPYTIISRTTLEFVCLNMEVKVTRLHVSKPPHRGGGRPSTLDLRKPPWKAIACRRNRLVVISRERLRSASCTCVGTRRTDYVEACGGLWHFGPGRRRAEFARGRIKLMYLPAVKLDAEK